MDLDPLRRTVVADVGKILLEALEKVGSRARSVLANTELPPDPTNVLAVTTNMYVHGPTEIVRQHRAGVASGRASLLALSREPFVARVVVTWEQGDGSSETLYFSRPCSFEMPDVRVLRYLAPLGRLAECEAGQKVAIVTPGGVRRGIVKERIRLRPGNLDGVWDGLDDSLEFGDWSVALDSLRRFLDEVDRLGLSEDAAADPLGTLLQQGAEALLIRDGLRRRVVDRISLRDQPILDRYQGDVFRGRGSPVPGVQAAADCLPADRTLDPDWARGTSPAVAFACALAGGEVSSVEREAALRHGVSLPR